MYSLDQRLLEAVCSCILQCGHCQNFLLMMYRHHGPRSPDGTNCNWLAILSFDVSCCQHICRWCKAGWLQHILSWVMAAKCIPRPDQRLLEAGCWCILQCGHCQNFLLMIYATIAGPQESRWHYTSYIVVTAHA